MYVSAPFPASVWIVSFILSIVVLWYSIYTCPKQFELWYNKYLMDNILSNSTQQMVFEKKKKKKKKIRPADPPDFGFGRATQLFFFFWPKALDFDKN